MRAMILDESGYQIKDIENDYETMKEIVGGYIEPVYLPNGIILIVNEEGKLMGLPIVGLLEWEGKLQDTINGQCILCADGGEDFTGLSDEQIAILKDEIDNRMAITNLGIHPVLTWR